MNKAEKVIEMMDGMKPQLWLVAKLMALVENTKDIQASLDLWVIQGSPFYILLQCNTGRVGAKRYTESESEWVEEGPRGDEAVDAFFRRADSFYDTYREAVKLIEEHRNEIREVRITKSKVEWVKENQTTEG